MQAVDSIQDQPRHVDIRTAMRYSDMTMDRKKKATEELDYEYRKRKGK